VLLGLMARVYVDFDGIDRAIRPELRLRARRALQTYRRARLKRDAAGYPFAQRPEDGSIRDPANSSVRPIPGGIRIKVKSRGARFIERGNDEGGDTIQGNLALPLRGGGKRGKRRFGAGKVIIGEDGRPYLMVQRVRTYRGRRLLERSVRREFTGYRGRV
jgi:hypothetical protein